MGSSKGNSTVKHIHAVRDARHHNEYLVILSCGHCYTLYTSPRMGQEFVCQQCLEEHIMKFEKEQK